MIGKAKKKAVPVNPETAERLFMERKAHDETQEDLAKVVDREKQTIARWEKGKAGVPGEKLILLAKHWGITPEYLMGQTAIKDPLQYYAECEDAAEAEYFEKERAERARMENLFEKCGFRYEDLSGASFDFCGIDESPSDDPEMAWAASTARVYRLTDLRAGDRPAAYFDATEIKELLDGLHGAISYACFCQWEKSRRRT